MPKNRKIVFACVRFRRTLRVVLWEKKPHVRIYVQAMVCHGQHTYMYACVVLQMLSQEAKGGAAVRRLQQEITKYAVKRWGFLH